MTKVLENGDHPRGLLNYAGSRTPPAEVMGYRGHRGNQKHMHPLQLDVIERAVTLYSNEGEAVLTPFMGVGSEVAAAVSLGRRGIGIELKPAYYSQAVGHLKSVKVQAEEQAEMFA